MSNIYHLTVGPPPQKQPFWGGGCFFSHKIFCSDFFWKFFLQFFRWVFFGIFGWGGRNFCTLPSPQFALKKIFEPIFWHFSWKKGAMLFLKCAWWVHIMMCWPKFCLKVSSMSKNPKRKKKLTQKFLAIFSGKNVSEKFWKFLFQGWC